MSENTEATMLVCGQKRLRRDEDVATPDQKTEKAPNERAHAGEPKPKRILVKVFWDEKHNTFIRNNWQLSDFYIVAEAFDAPIRDALKDVTAQLPATMCVDFIASANVAYACNDPAASRLLRALMATLDPPVPPTKVRCVCEGLHRIWHRRQEFPPSVADRLDTSPDNVLTLLVSGPCFCSDICKKK